MILALAAPAAQPMPEPFTAALQKILKESRDRFIDTKGARIELTPGPGLWFEARTFLPGAEYCQVDRGADSYRCEWATAPARLRAKHEEIVTSAEKALGPKWRKEAQRNFVQFLPGAKSDPEVRVTIKDGKVWLIVLIPGS
jgi:hypothetical protein